MCNIFIKLWSLGVFFFFLLKFTIIDILNKCAIGSIILQNTETKLGCKERKGKSKEDSEMKMNIYIRLFFFLKFCLLGLFVIFFLKKKKEKKKETMGFSVINEINQTMNMVSHGQHFPM